MLKRWIMAAVAILVLLPAMAWAGPGVPSLTNNPGRDAVATNVRPVLSFFNADGDVAAYQLELSPSPDFPDGQVIRYTDIPPGDKVTAKRVEAADGLKDNARWHWRVRAVDADGTPGPWAANRFFVDTSSDDRFMGLVRVMPADAAVSSGFCPKNIFDLNDPGQATFWQSAPFDESDQWVRVDLGRTRTVSRIWMLSSIDGRNGWLKDFHWQYSHDGREWTDVEGGAVSGNDTHRNILDIAATSARHWRLSISDWHGYAAQINALCLYGPGRPDVPTPPRTDYVVVVGDQMNGFTFTQLARRIENLGLDLETVTVPHYEFSLDMLEQLDPRPLAVIFSGNNAGYENLPMFEYNGNFEVIRHSDLPILGICCGHQLTVMAYGLTFARAMGWTDVTALDPPPFKRDIEIVRPDPLFEGIEGPFSAPEVHGWAVYTLPDHYQVLARSSYIQSVRRTDKTLYGVQFHPEIDAAYNDAEAVLVNFLEMARERAR
jgi:GMP synthase-like glutamine amidotransferase